MKHHLSLVTPRINLNGNTADSLVTQISDILDDINSLIETMSQYEGNHGRNFQTVPDHGGITGDLVARNARDAWTERLITLGEMRHEMLELGLAIQRQGDDRLPGPRAGPDSEKRGAWPNWGDSPEGFDGPTGAE
jgi:hypothetical protein